MHLCGITAYIFELLPKTVFFSKSLAIALLINIVFNLNWSGSCVDKMFRNKSCKMSKSSRRKVGLHSMKAQVDILKINISLCVKHNQVKFMMTVADLPTCQA